MYAVEGNTSQIIDEIAALVEAGNDEGAVTAFYANSPDFYYENPDQFASDFEDAYAGGWGSFREFADDFVESTGMLIGADETLARYFDYESFARDLGFDYWCADAPVSGVFVFRSV